MGYCVLRNADISDVPAYDVYSIRSHVDTICRIFWNLKTYFYGDTVFSAMQTLAMYQLKMSTVYEVTQTPFVGYFGCCILDHLHYSLLNPHPHLKFFFFFPAPFNHIRYVLKTAHFNSRFLLNG